jgi:phosphoribosyl 1,2-cyclic phosphodiesterase
MHIQTLASSSKGNCFRISDGYTPLLIEAGIPWRQIQQGLGFRTSEIQACLVSHGHKDHSKAANDVMRAAIDVYTSKETATILGLNGHRLHEIETGVQFNIGTWTILPFETEHDCEGSLGFLLYSNKTREKMLFLTDSYYCKYRFKGLTHIMIECNYAHDILQQNIEAGLIDSAMKNRLLQSHFSLDHVKQFLRANDLSQVKEIHLIHLSAGNSDAERFRREVMAVTGKPVIVAGEYGR